MERAAVWMYLEWMSQPENLFRSAERHRKARTIRLTQTALPVKNPDFDGEAKLSQNNNKDYWWLVTEAPTYVREDQTKKVLRASWSPTGFEYSAKTC